MRAESRSGRSLKLLFQGIGAHRWILERRIGIARGIYNRLVEDDRLSGKQILAEAQGCLNTLIANGKPRRLIAYNKSFNSTDVKIGDASLFYKTANK